MSKNICPYCQDITEQTSLAKVQGSHSSISGITSIMNILICHRCGKSIEHEEVIMQSCSENISIPKILENGGIQ